MKMVRNSEGSPLSAVDALAVDHYRSKQHWVEFNDDLFDTRPEGIDLVERSHAWIKVNKLFRNLEKDDQRALQMVVIDGMSLRQTAQQLDVSAMKVQRRVKRGLNTLAKELKAAQLGACASRSICSWSVCIAALRADSCRSAPSRQNRSIDIFRS